MQIRNLTAAPQLRTTASGTAVADFTVASTPRVFDRQARHWRDGDTLFLGCTIWRDQAEHVAALRKGDRVIVVGRLRQRSYQTREGDKRTVVELEVDEVGASLRHATAKVNKVGHDNNTPPGAGAEGPGNH